MDRRDIAAQNPGAIVVCGLGRLGRECAQLVKAFGAPVIGVDATENAEISGLDGFVDGDCARSDTLKRAGVDGCRTVLILTDDSRVNVVTAFAARRLNPTARIVLRSAQENLNLLLGAQLGDVVAFDPSQFAALAFAVAALADETRARFDLADSKVRVAAHRVEKHDWCDGRTPADLHSLHQRVIGHAQGEASPLDLFAQATESRKIEPGDEITFISYGDPLAKPRRGRREAKQRKRSQAGALLGQARGWLRAAPLATLISLIVTIALTLGAVLLYRAENPDISWFDAINVAVVLAVGGFDNIFGALKAPFPISPFLYFYSVLMKIGSAVFLGIIFATITEKVLGARFAIAARRPDAPAEDHTVIVGLGPIGQNVAAQLRQWGLASVGVCETPPEADFLRDMPIASGAVREALERANVASARSVVVAGDDQVDNLETMLLARSLNPSCDLVFRVADPELAANVSALIPESLGISEWEVAAQAITGAAFGESILAAFRLPTRAILVTQYKIEAGDTLNGRLLAHIAYGYGAIPLLHERGATRQLNPSDDIRLEIGDDLVVLAAIDALGRIERGELRPPQRRLRIESCAFAANAFEAGNVIARIAGCDLATARRALEGLPRALEVPVHPPQGARLMRELQKLGVLGSLLDTENAI